MRAHGEAVTQTQGGAVPIFLRIPKLREFAGEAIQLHVQLYVLRVLLAQVPELSDNHG